MVFQRPNPLPISIYENVLFGIRVAHAPRLHAAASRTRWSKRRCRDVQLWDEVKDRLHGKAAHLTLEQQQKLCIARLLPLEAAGDPDGRALLGAGRRGRRADRELIGELAGTVHDR